MFNRTMSINFIAYHKLRQNISTNSTKIGLVFLVDKGGKFWEDIMVLVIFKVFKNLPVLFTVKNFIRTLLVKLQHNKALSFYRSKMILDRPNCFGQIQIVLVGSKSFWSGPNHFGWVQIILVTFKLDFYSLIFIIWAFPKWFQPIQNKLGASKMIGAQPKWFGQSKIILGP